MWFICNHISLLAYAWVCVFVYLCAVGDIMVKRSQDWWLLVDVQQILSISNHFLNFFTYIFNLVYHCSPPSHKITDAALHHLHNFCQQFHFNILIQYVMLTWTLYSHRLWGIPALHRQYMTNAVTLCEHAVFPCGLQDDARAAYLQVCRMCALE